MQESQEPNRPRQPWSNAKRAIAITLVLITFCAGFIAFSWHLIDFRTGDVPVLSIYGWERTGYFEVRRDSRSTDDLLLSPEPVPPHSHSHVYRYNTKSGIFTAVANSAWEASDAPINKSSKHGFISGPVLLVQVENRLKYGDRSATASGSTILAHYVSPTESLVALISVDGSERPFFSIFPFMGGHGGGFAGQHYVEFFDLPSLQRRGNAIRLPEEGFSVACWSADENYLVIPQTDYKFVCAVPVPPKDSIAK